MSNAQTTHEQVCALGAAVRDGDLSPRATRSHFGRR
jgi:hypothetical protein